MSSKQKRRRPSPVASGRREAHSGRALAPTDRNTDSRTPQGSGDAPHGSGDGVPVMVAYPSRRMMGVVLCLLIFHFAALAVGMLAVISPASIVTACLGRFEPYLKLTHFGPDGSRTYLVGSEIEEQALRLETSVQNTPASDSDWTEVSPPAGLFAGGASSDRFQRWLGWVVTLAESEQSDLAAELLAAAVIDSPKVRCVRIVREPTLLLDEVQLNQGPPYFARVIRTSGMGVQLIADSEPRLSALVTPRVDVRSRNAAVPQRPQSTSEPGTAP